MATTPKAYTATPTLAQWQKDSSVSLARRSDDDILTRIDQLIGAYETCGSDYARLQLKSDLFFTLDYWLKVHTSKRGMSKARQPAIYELYKFTAHSLAAMLSCTINTLPEYLERHFGRKRSYHGEHLDIVGNLATYLSRAEVDKYRITFRKGKAYMFDWPGKGQEATVPNKKGQLVSGEKQKPSGMKLVLADSASAANPGVFGRGRWGGFAMSMGRDLFMARHHNDTGAAGPGDNGNFYHSSYLAGDAVLCAGTILIENGYIRGVRNDSGHYQPDAKNLVSFLQALMMQGVNVQTVLVYDFIGKHCANGNEFLANGGVWIKSLLGSQPTAYAANDAAARQYISQKAEHRKQVAHLWQQAVSGGIVGNTEEGRFFFARRLLRNYTTPTPKDPKRPSPYDYDVNTTWILEVIHMAYGPVPGAPPPKNPLPSALQNHGKLPPRPPARGLPPGQRHGALPPRRP
jgi:hypothetical protein